MNEDLLERYKKLRKQMDKEIPKEFKLDEEYKKIVKELGMESPEIVDFDSIQENIETLVRKYGSRGTGED